MASPDQSILPRLELTASPRQPPALTDDALEEIFLRVASHADLARAATACVSFRRFIADPNFLRRHRSRHPPILLGFLDGRGEVFHPVEAPHPNAPVARAFGSASDFSCNNYIPNNTEHSWVRDVGDGRVLIEVLGSPVDDVDFDLSDLKVYDPLLRQYLLLPRIPQDLLASLQIEELDIVDFTVSLLPSRDWEEASFRVLRVIRNSARLVACVFCSTSGCWSVGASTILDVPSAFIPLCPMQPPFAYNCCYWEAIHPNDPNKLLKLDMERMESSTVDLPPDHGCPLWHSITIVEAGEGNLGMFKVIDDESGTTSVVYYICMQNVSGRANEWHLKNTTPVARYFCGFVGSAGRYVFLVHRQEHNGSLLPEYVCSSLEIKTSNIERLSRTRSHFCFPYFGFPPSMSPRRILKW